MGQPSAMSDSILTDRHHASNGNYEADDPQNQIGGIIPTLPLSGWLRHGMEAVVQQRGGTACHPSESTANFRKTEVTSATLATATMRRVRMSRIRPRTMAAWSSTCSAVSAVSRGK